MAKKKRLKGFVTFLAWLVGLVVSLAIGGALIAGTLVLPAFLGGATATGLIIAKIAGWIIVVGALLGVLMAIVDTLR